MPEPIDLDAIQALYDADMEVDDYVPALIAELREARATIARVRNTIDAEHYASTEGNLIVAMHNLREALEGDL